MLPFLSTSNLFLLWTFSAFLILVAFIFTVFFGAEFHSELIRICACYRKKTRRPSTTTYEIDTIRCKSL